MKQILKTAAACVLLTSLTFAQGFGRRSAGGTPTPPDPAMMIANQVARLTTLLDLTTAQASQITSILTAAQSSVSTLQTSLNTDRTNLTAAITSNNTATITSISSDMGNLQGQILAINSKAEASIYALLTSDQQTKLSTLGGVGLLGGPGGFGGPLREPGPGPGL
jgi:Spy/CpxP family protein refolding chaperone